MDIDINDSELSDVCENLELFSNYTDKESDSDSDVYISTSDVGAIEQCRNGEIVVVDSQNKAWNTVITEEKPVMLQGLSVSPIKGGYFNNGGSGDTYDFSEEDAPLREAVKSVQQNGKLACGYNNECDVMISDEIFMEFSGCDPLKAFMGFIDENLVDTLVRCTNHYAAVTNNKYRKSCWKDITREDMMGFLGILICMSCYNCTKINLRNMWGSECGIRMIKATMSRDRFCRILSCLRMDYYVPKEVTDKPQNVRDKIAPLKFFWQHFLTNCRSTIIPSRVVNLDEMLYKYCGTDILKSNLQSHPRRYGFKLIVVADTVTQYVHNAALFVPAARGVRATQKLLREQVDIMLEDGFVVDGTSRVLTAGRLLRPYFGSGRIVATSKLFTSCEMALALQTVKLHLVGEVASGSPDVPGVVFQHSGRSPGSVLRLKRPGLHLESQMPGPRVLLAAHTPEQPDSLSVWPRLCDSGVQAVHARLQAHSTKRNSRDWTSYFLFAILDLACINAAALHRKTSSSPSHPAHFLFELAGQLCRVRQESQRPDRQIYVRSSRRCHLCVRVNGINPYRLTRLKSHCVKCQRAVCKRHTTTYCHMCRI